MTEASEAVAEPSPKDPLGAAPEPDPQEREGERDFRPPYRVIRLRGDGRGGGRSRRKRLGSHLPAPPGKGLKI